MKTEILKIKGNWQDVVNDCRTTVSKPPLGKEPSKKFKQQLLISEHSPIRNISVKWQWRDIKSWVATHWSRHKWECYISTQRSDRTGVDRDKLPQDSPVTFSGEANVQNLIDTMRKRLCCQASPETRKLAEDFKRAIYEHEPEISDVLVPNCVYRCGCPEGGNQADSGGEGNADLHQLRQGVRSRKPATIEALRGTVRGIVSPENARSAGKEASGIGTTVAGAFSAG